MLTLKIICVGKIKDKHLQALIQEYSKRILKYAKLDMVEIPDEKIPDQASPAEEEAIKEKECAQIWEKLQKISNPYIFALDLKGKQLSSEDFSSKIETIATYSSSTIVFVIGGSLGLTKKLVAKCHFNICFSQMTFPHQLIRVFLLEQIFRAFKIQHHEKYHK